MADFDVGAFVAKLESLGVKLTAVPLADGKVRINRWRMPNAVDAMQIENLWSTQIGTNQARIDLLASHLAGATVKGTANGVPPPAAVPTRAAPPSPPPTGKVPAGSSATSSPTSTVPANAVRTGALPTGTAAARSAVRAGEVAAKPQDRAGARPIAQSPSVSPSRPPLAARRNA